MLFAIALQKEVRAEEFEHVFLIEEAEDQQQAERQVLEQFADPFDDENRRVSIEAIQPANMPGVIFDTGA